MVFRGSVSIFVVVPGDMGTWAHGHMGTWGLCGFAAGGLVLVLNPSHCKQDNRAKRALKHHSRHAPRYDISYENVRFSLTRG